MMLKKLILAAAILVTQASACQACPYLTVTSGCYNIKIEAGSYHVVASVAGEYALEINYGNVLRRVEGATLISANVGDPLTFTTAFIPFRIVWRPSGGIDWLPASNEVTAFPLVGCVLV
jgi:hypothetical protein